MADELFATKALWYSMAFLATDSLWKLTGSLAKKWGWLMLLTFSTEEKVTHRRKFQA